MIRRCARPREAFPLQIAFHIGANCTDEDRLLKSILKNTDALVQQSIAVPGPGKYRRLIREAIQALDGEHPAPDTRNILIDAIVEDDEIVRLVMSNDNFLTVPKRIFDHSLFYPQADTKVRGLHQLFPNDELTLFIGLRNPASFLQEAARRAQPASLQTYLGMQDAVELRWSDVIRRIKLAAPQTPLYVWCNEDTPLIWEDLIRRISGISAQDQVIGRTDLLSDLVTPEGLTVLKSRLDACPIDDRMERHNIIADIMEAYAVPDSRDEEIDLPGLDADTVAEMSEAYEADIDQIGEMEGVELILPFA